VASIAARERTVKRTTIYRLRAEWKARKQDEEREVETDRQTTLPHVEQATAPALEAQGMAAGTATTVSSEGLSLATPEEHNGAGGRIGAVEPTSSGMVQHVGSWLMMAMVAKLGLPELAERHRGPKLGAPALRVALDATIAALSIGERCVEGVRRLATASGHQLLRSSRAPSASWVRRVVGRFAQTRGPWLHLDMGARYMQRAREDEDTPVVFYVDNHLRPYSGKEVVRRGWRMQDKRVLPGASDYYVHDEDGRPVLRFDAPDNGPLTAWLTPIANLLRLALGPAQKIMLAFDRAGAYPQQLAELRDRGFEFVTYERRPYPLLASTAFESSAKLDDEEVAIHDARINLGKGRGRLRRIAIRFVDGKQINLLAVSDQPAQRLLDVMRGRWNQETRALQGRARLESIGLARATPQRMRGGTPPRPYAIRGKLGTASKPRSKLARLSIMPSRSSTTSSASLKLRAPAVSSTASSTSATKWLASSATNRTAPSSNHRRTVASTSTRSGGLVFRSRARRHRTDTAS